MRNLRDRLDTRNPFSASNVECALPRLTVSSKSLNRRSPIHRRFRRFLRRGQTPHLDLKPSLPFPTPCPIPRLRHCASRYRPRRTEDAFLAI